MNYTIPMRRSTDPESPTFEPTVLLALRGKPYYVHLDVYNELKRLEGALVELSQSNWDASDVRGFAHETLYPNQPDSAEGK